MDAVVIGGGLIGLATASRLARRGLQVSVWDAGRVGTESSWAGAGMLAPGGEMDRRSWWTDLAVASLAQYPEFVIELQEESGVAIDFRCCGALESAASEREWVALQQRAERQKQWGIPVQHAGSRQLFYPADSAVNPRDLLRALRAICDRQGVQLREGQAVREIKAESGRIVAPEPAAVAVLAAGAWSSSIPIVVGGAAVPVERSLPVRGHLVSFAPGGLTPGPIVRQGHTYILERSNGLAVAGSTTEEVGYSREPDPEQFADIERRARALMPSLRGRERVDSWIGFRPATQSGEPQLGRLADSPVYLAYGHYRNGILMAPATANLIADAITANSETDSSLQDASR